jgi:hypothetical protein
VRECYKDLPLGETATWNAFRKYFEYEWSEVTHVFHGNHYAQYFLHDDIKEDNFPKECSKAFQHPNLISDLTCSVDLGIRMNI